MPTMLPPPPATPATLRPTRPPSSATPPALTPTTLIAGYLAFGRLADLRARRGASILPLIAGGVGTASLCLALLALGVTTGALALWGIFTFAGSAATLAYALLLRRFPTEMAGRLNTTVNSFVFLAMFLGQWLVG